MREVPYCFQCWPGGPIAPPPCRKCGSTNDYYTSGLCARCHSHAPGEKSPLWQSPGTLARQTVVVDSCLDCHAWGVTRTYGWLCVGCRSWREKYRHKGVCDTCGNEVALNEGGSCRLCCKTRSLLAQDRDQRPSSISLAEANVFGQQLFFAGMWHREGQGQRPYVKKTIPPNLSLLHPVPYEQLVLLELPRDLKAGLRKGFPPPPDPAREAAWHQFVREHAAAHGWSRTVTERAQRAIRMLLGMQDTPGAAIRASDVLPLSRIRHPVRPVLDVLTVAGMLADDRVPPTERWFQLQITGLPEDIRHELEVWFDIARNGSTTPPRFRPRSDNTVRSQLGYALPIIRAWARTHPSLREIGRDDVLAALPPSGSPRSSTLQGLRSIFRILKARKLTFINPTTRISVPTPDKHVPAPIDLTELRGALNSDDPTRAALAALLAFHAIRIWQLLQLQLADVRDGRLYLPDRIVPLAEPVRARVSAYLDYRQRTWPDTANPHLFIHYRNANTTTPATPWWIRKRLGMIAQAIRQDRILDEAHATGGDVRQLCELFGLSIAGAYRYTSSVDHPGIAEYEQSTKE
ncbi:site-specific recombinase XerD [Amycolatopsis echigonensis]|nr:site-specific recombinase XerD [Amycolatopsis niigatensis]PKV92435.1 site-specific recombinase XerD [Amycolatopsis niigatensis]PKV94784.1 site-specific recombinase XerD [Amycolatopsis niigatensis]